MFHNFALYRNGENDKYALYGFFCPYSVLQSSCRFVVGQELFHCSVIEDEYQESQGKTKKQANA